MAVKDNSSPLLNAQIFRHLVEHFVHDGHQVVDLAGGYAEGRGDVHAVSATKQQAVLGEALGDAVGQVGLGGEVLLGFAVGN